MSDRNIQLTKKQQDLLLRGLRYVRSSIALDARDWSPEVETERQEQYDEIARVEALLNGAKIVEAATV
ncbi:hypothetical protein KOR42_01070 [Thalassoglobus neptunius]|uniref:Uncharacterized protein n=1 Tax=Thalassoglobus neptunius TaxID=1938619 RepID=A0A5C5X3P6_9PLAN|nr:hypothetical protein [Thalassoglobus neptunius]TWT56752.1 hypothetical protein KOR42_01070 [Thalassoglobus neptunius]